MSQAKRNAQAWKKNILSRSKILHKKLQQISSFYGQNPVVPTLAEIQQAFAYSLIDVSRYCVDNHINARNVDTVKLMAFSIPHLLSIRSYAVRLDMYTHACLLVIHGNRKPALTYRKNASTANVSTHLCTKFPSQYMVMYGYLKGYQESLELNNP